jgi:thiol:disulfide interchange protein/DsbC/DsbD-like thiol-disulfide interchange protein
MIRSYLRCLAVFILASGMLASVCYAEAGRPELGFQDESRFDRHPVQARLVFDRSDLSAGGPLTAAIVLQMDDHWHTYWEFSGDAGLPTKLEWQLPQGIEAGPLQWAGPTRYTESGDLTVFGYADKVVLLTPLTVAGDAALSPDDDLTVQVSWLVCADICIPGDTTLSVRLDHLTSNDVDAGLIEDARQHLIKPWSAEDDARVSLAATVRVTDVGHLDVAVELQSTVVDGGLPDLYPSEPVGTYIEANARQATATGARVQFRVVPYVGESRPTRMGVVVAIADAQGRMQYRRTQIELTPASSVDLFAVDFSQNEPEHSLWAYLLMALVGGMILNLMPCVLPVISLKVMSLVSQAGEAPERIRHHGIAFCAGVVTTFLLLAFVVIAIKSTGELIGWGFQFQSPLFVIGLASLVFVLALSLFGVLSVRLPGDTGRLGVMADQKGITGSFANGILATILATPCTAPFLGTALGFAFSQPALTTLAIFSVTGFGMALPYALLAARPGGVRWLPAPGPWMEYFKQSMAFLLMATTVWLLWVLGRQLGMEAVVWTTAFLLCLAAASTMVGQWIDLRSTTRHRRVMWGIAILLVIISYRLLIHPLLLDPRPVAAHVEGEAGQWADFDRHEVEDLIGQGRIVFIDFTADWCWTCKVNERVVLADKQVQDAFAAADVALIKADWTHREPDITKMLVAFGRPGVPLYVIFAGGTGDDPIILPEIITSDLVTAAIDKAAARSKNQ